MKPAQASHIESQVRRRILNKLGDYWDVEKHSIEDLSVSVHSEVLINVSMNVPVVIYETASGQATLPVDLQNTGDWLTEDWDQVAEKAAEAFAASFRRLSD